MVLHVREVIAVVLAHERADAALVRDILGVAEREVLLQQQGVVDGRRADGALDARPLVAVHLCACAKQHNHSE